MQQSAKEPVAAPPRLPNKAGPLALQGPIRTSFFDPRPLQVIGIDTNVLVRYLTQDEPKQYARAKTALETRCTEAKPGVIQPIVLCELAWVLQSAYDVGDVELARAIEQILRTRQFHVPQRDVVRQALTAFRDGTAGFADCLIGHLNAAEGAHATVTFDRRAAKLRGWEAL